MAEVRSRSREWVMWVRARERPAPLARRALAGFSQACHPGYPDLGAGLGPVPHALQWKCISGFASRGALTKLRHSWHSPPVDDQLSN